MQLISEPDRNRFGNGGRLREPNDLPADELNIKLDRTYRQKETFRLARHVTYDDAHSGLITVPPTYGEFDTDLTSVPRLFTWLVPKTGVHLPAALIHDGLISDKGQPQTYTLARGSNGKEPAARISRVEADRIFRDGMRDLNTNFIRRWLVWAAVTIGTMWSRTDTAKSHLGRTYYQLIWAVTVLGIAGLGVFATADLLDAKRTWRWYGEVPWIDDGPLWEELFYGVAGAVVIPFLVGLMFWGRFRRAGMITGISVGVLLFPMVGIALVGGINWIGEKITSSEPGIVVLGTLSSMAVVASGVTCWITLAS